VSGYPVILADPPWKYRRSTGRGAAENHYPPMTVEELCGMAQQVRELADSSCALFMWSTFPTLHTHALAVLEEWGWTYKTAAFVWLKVSKYTGKPVMGSGEYTRSNVEPCLIAIRGKIPFRKDRGVRQVILEPEVIEAPRVGHSVKPPLYSRIERMYDGPYLELFATREADGWDRSGLMFGDDYCAPRD
jgi:N6-adenosine-specific RNA methylase IME4